MSPSDSGTKRDPGTKPTAYHDGRTRILEAAIKSFAELGYAGTSTAGVARAAGVAQPLVHHHFVSKEGLWRAAIDHLFADVPAIVARVEDDGTVADSLVPVVEHLVLMSARRPEILRIISREGTVPSERLSYILEHHLRAPFQRAVAAIRAGQRAGTIDPDLRPELLLFFILGAVGHLFDVPALAKEALGIDVAEADTREAFVCVIRRVLAGGVLRRKEQG
jgi:AcrR family transcriptional regulator